MNRYYSCNGLTIEQMDKRKTEQFKPVSSFVYSVDDATMKLMVEYFRIRDYDCLVNFVRKMGIQTNQQ